MEELPVLFKTLKEGQAFTCNAAPDPEIIFYKTSLLIDPFHKPQNSRCYFKNDNFSGIVFYHFFEDYTLVTPIEPQSFQLSFEEKSSLDAALHICYGEGVKDLSPEECLEKIQKILEKILIKGR